MGHSKFVTCTKVPKRPKDNDNNQPLDVGEFFWLVEGIDDTVVHIADEQQFKQRIVEDLEVLSSLRSFEKRAEVEGSLNLGTFQKKGECHLKSLSLEQSLHAQRLVEKCGQILFEITLKAESVGKEMAALLLCDGAPPNRFKSLVDDYQRGVASLAAILPPHYLL